MGVKDSVRSSKFTCSMHPCTSSPNCKQFWKKRSWVRFSI